MEDWIGKTCSYCKAEFWEGDSVRACPACGSLFHQECWARNGGCSACGSREDGNAPRQNGEGSPPPGEAPPEPAAGAPSQELAPDQGSAGGPAQPAHGQEAAVSLSAPGGDDPPDRCPNCKTILNEGQAFCPKCGTRRSPTPAKLCGSCGAELTEGQAFCPKCGWKTGLAPDLDSHSAIERYNGSVRKKARVKKQVPIIIGVVVVLIAALGIYLFQSMRAKQLEAAKAAYLADANSFVSLAYSAGVNLESIADTVQQYWYDSIWYDMYGDDINVAIRTALTDKSTELDKADSHYTQMQALYGKLKSLPDRVEDSYYEDVGDAVKTLYNVYTDYYSFATSPSGNYNSFSGDNSSKTNDYIAACRTLTNLLSNGQGA